MELDPAIRAYYDKGEEASRLARGSGAGELELERTKELIQRFLPPGELDIVDVGGGPGVYAAWLADQGHRVQLVDPVPLHVEQASAAHPQIRAEVGDARALPFRDGTVDVVLLLGPLYHLIDRDHRLEALREAARVLRPSGLLFSAAISRHAALVDLLVNWDKLHEPGVMELVEKSVGSGVFTGSGQEGLFTTAYFHRREGLSEELSDVGLADIQVFNVEGPGFVVADLDSRMRTPERKEALMEAIRMVELDPEMVSSHFLAVAIR